MRISIFKANGIKAILNSDADLVVIASDLELCAELKAHGIPEDRIGWLPSLSTLNKSQCIFLEKGVYERYRAEEMAEIQRLEGDTIGQDSNQ